MTSHEIKTSIKHIIDEITEDFLGIIIRYVVICLDYVVYINGAHLKDYR